MKVSEVLQRYADEFNRNYGRGLYNDRHGLVDSIPLAIAQEAVVEAARHYINNHELLPLREALRRLDELEKGQ